MPRCENDYFKYYRGDENTPLGRGYSASAESIGTKKVGLDGNKYVVVKWGNGKRWSRVASSKKRKNPKGFNWMKGSKLGGFFTKKQGLFDKSLEDLPLEMEWEIINNLDCDSLLAFRATSKENKELVDANMKHFYHVMREKHPDLFPDIDIDSYEGQGLVKKVISLCNDRYRQRVLNSANPDYFNDLDPLQMKKAGRLLEAGASDQSAYGGAQDLDDEQIENMLRLLKAGATYGFYAYDGAQDLDDVQFENMLRLLKAGASGYSAYDGAKDLDVVQIENMSRLLEAGAYDLWAKDGAQNLDDAKIENMLLLLEAGVDDKFAYRGAKDLDDAQIENMLRLLEAGADG